MKITIGRGVFMAAALLLAARGTAGAQSVPAAPHTLDRIKQTQTLRIAYRPDAPPFSLKDNLGQPAGFMVDLCKAVAEGIRQQLNIPTLNVTYVAVTAVNRFDAIQQGQADMLCGPTSVTLQRRQVVDFSISTYVDGAGLLVHGDGPQNFQGLAGKAIGVVGGTTTEQALRNSLAEAKMQADVVTVKTYSDGLALLDASKIAAFFGDRSILETIAPTSKAPGKLALANQYLTVEPYAIALPHGDEDFRLAIDTSLSAIYKSDAIPALFARYFGPSYKPSQVLQTLYLIAPYPP